MRRRPGAGAGAGPGQHHVSHAVWLSHRVRRDHVRRHGRDLRQARAQREDRGRPRFVDGRAAGDRRQRPAVTHGRHGHDQSLRDEPDHRGGGRDLPARHLLRDQRQGQPRHEAGGDGWQDHWHRLRRRCHGEHSRHDAGRPQRAEGCRHAAGGRERAGRLRTRQAGPHRGLHRHQRYRPPARGGQAARAGLVDGRGRALPGPSLHDFESAAREEPGPDRQVPGKRARIPRRHDRRDGPRADPRLHGAEIRSVRGQAPRQGDVRAAAQLEQLPGAIPGQARFQPRKLEIGVRPHAQSRSHRCDRGSEFLR